MSALTISIDVADVHPTIVPAPEDGEASGTKKRPTPPKWLALELQGVLAIRKNQQVIPENEDAPSAEDVAGKVIGRMELTGDAAVLVVGHHRLEGKRVKLTKPLAILERSEDVAAIASEISSKTSASNKREAPGSVTSTSFRVVGLIEEKIAFKTRPKPLTDSDLVVR